MARCRLPLKPYFLPRRIIVKSFRSSSLLYASGIGAPGDWSTVPIFSFERIFRRVIAGKQDPNKAANGLKSKSRLCMLGAPVTRLYEPQDEDRVERQKSS